MKPAYLLLPVFLCSFFLQALPSALAGGSSAGVYETSIGDRHLTAGQADQLLLSFTVEPWKAVPGDLTVSSMDITCAPAHGFTTVKLMKGETKLSSATFTAVGTSGNQKAHFGSSLIKLPNGVKTELKLLVTLEKNTGDFVTACAIDDLFLKNSQTGKIFSAEAQAVRFAVNHVITVDDSTVDITVPTENMTVTPVRVINLPTGSKNNLLLDVNLNAADSIRVEDLFIFCDRGNIIQNYRLDVDGKSIAPAAVQNDWYTNSRPEHSSDDRVVFTNLGLKTGRGDGIRLKLYGDTYSYFSHSPSTSMSCSVLKLRTANPLTALEEVTAYENSLVTRIDSTLTTRMLGKILLQVDAHGQAWYVDPTSKKKYYLPDGAAAYQALRSFGLGISNADLAKIPDAASTVSTRVDTRLVNRMRGRILLQTESHGEAWYVNPANGKRYYLKDGDAAYQIMRSLSLGVKDTDLRKIAVGLLTPTKSVITQVAVSPAVDCGKDMTCFADAAQAKKNAHFADTVPMPSFEEYIPGISGTMFQTWNFSTTFDGAPYTFNTKYGATVLTFEAGWFEQFLQTPLAEQLNDRINESTYLTEEELDMLEPTVQAHYAELLAAGKSPQEIVKEIAAYAIEDYVRSSIAVTDDFAGRTCTFSDLPAFVSTLKEWQQGNFSSDDMGFARCYYEYTQ